MSNDRIGHVAPWKRVCLFAAATLAGLAWEAPPHSVRAENATVAAKAARRGYSEKIAAKYNDHFSVSAHFMPSNMTTDTGEFIDPKSFPTAQYCGHCHQEAQHQWRQSAHSNSNRAPWYLKNVGLLNDEKGVEFSRHCEGCHDPIAMVAGNLTQGSAKRRPFDEDGVTCSVCHSIQKVDTRGTGSYVLGVPAVLMDENGDGLTRPVSDADILTHLDRHFQAVMKDFYRTSEFCAACHKAALPRQLNDYKWLRAISLYDEWQNSAFARQSPLPFYSKDSVSTCQTCHMQREPVKLQDYGAKRGQFASHRWLGANTIIPKYYAFDEQAKRIVEFLQNGVLNVDIFALEPQTPNTPDKKLIAPLGRATFRLAAGERFVADIVIQNKGAAHSHVPEQRDMYESWVSFTVSDASGKVLQQSGYIKSNGDLDERAHSFTNRLVNRSGNLNSEHQVWNNRVVAYTNTIQSGRSQIVRYLFHVPEAAVGPITLTAAVRYRRFDQHFMDFGMGKHYEQPIVDMASQTRMLIIGENHPILPTPTETPEWMRWNNYGIATLDAQQYDVSIKAFENVARLCAGYADAYTNMAVTELQREGYEAALSYARRALRISPSNARALYYRALAEHKMGKIADAADDLQTVAMAFPRSRDTHRELGLCLYEEHRYWEAVKEYEAVQAIDPDDVPAHYYLALLYRQLGQADKAIREAALYGDKKDDPTSTTLTFAYLRDHNEIANESMAWHVHIIDK